MTSSLVPACRAYPLTSVVRALLLAFATVLATTLVATPAGPVPIGTIEVGDLVMPFLGRGGLDPLGDAAAA